MKDLRLVFMGTPEFAVATLGSLIMNGFNVVSVVTAPDKPSGRGRKMNVSAVKEFAEESLIPVLQPENLKDPVFISELKRLDADLFIVVAFRMLPEVVWKMPSIGTVNLHASLLPDYRGAAPINHAIINGEKVTGVTTFFIDDKIDTGNILLSEEVPIFPFEDAGDLSHRLMKKGAMLMVRTINEIAENKIKQVAQLQLIDPGKSLKPAPKIHPEDCIIDWNKEAVKIHNFIRGLSPAPCARSFFKSRSSILAFKIFETLPETVKHLYKPGEIITDGKNFIKIACVDGFLSIISLQLEGKKRMNINEFLRGFRINEYTVSFSSQA